jgi:hypothetical protein
VLDDGSSFASFVVTAGQMFHVDSGAPAWPGFPTPLSRATRR